MWADRHAPLAFLVAMIAVLSFTTPGFAALDTIVNMARQYAIIIVLAIAQTIVMISGGIDLSVGSVLALSGVVAGQMLTQHLPTSICLATGVLVGCLCGVVNGAVISLARVPAFIATLGMMGMARGLTLARSGGVMINPPASTFAWINDRGIVLALLFVGLMVGVAVLAHLLLSRTTFGRHNYAIGGNREAARLSGINISRHTVMVFALSGLVASVAGMMTLLYAGTADPTAGDGYELESIAAAVIGGTSLFGGRGSVGGTVVGAFILAVLKKGCNLHDISDAWQRFVVGLMTVLAVFYDRLRRRGEPQ